MEIETFHHFAIAVWDIDKYRPYFADGFGFEIEQEFVDEQAGTKGIFFKLPGTNVGLELMQPLSEEGSVARNMRQRGEGLHHISFRTPDVRGVREGIEATGLRTLVGFPPYIIYNTTNSIAGSLPSFLSPILSPVVYGIGAVLYQSFNIPAQFIARATGVTGNYLIPPELWPFTSLPSGTISTITFGSALADATELTCAVWDTTSCAA